MTSLIKGAFKKSIRMLEIGVWYGAGSTSIWLDNCEPGSEIVLLDAWRPYASEADVAGEEFRHGWNYAKMDSLSSDAFLSAYLNVRRFENERSERNVDVTLIRGDSGRFLNLFKEQIFDFIYIDADHKYESVKTDIVNAKKLINREFGVICGDDLEKLPTPELVGIARKYKNRDYLKGEYGYHPGVCLAVSEEFGSVNMVDGFWWIVCENGSFNSELFKPAP